MKTKQIANTELKVNCPNCNSSVYVLIEKLRRGEHIRCPKCQFEFDSAVLLKMIPDTKQDIKNDVTDRLESDPGRYYKEFAPIWKRYILFLKIHLGIFIPTAALFIIFINASDNVYWQYGLALFGLTAALVPWYFVWGVRCPRCGRNLILGPFGLGIGSTYFWMVGLCPRCGVRLKNREVSDKAWQIIRMSILTMCVITLLALLYFQLTQGTCIKISY